uniref:Pancreatic progenitor cell differentiation and proliferation factor a n=1 Tax=Gasterosteus aculeatus aculeatus TaxID=481459 RepID=A0AAQ4RF81_GASAC
MAAIPSTGSLIATHDYYRRRLGSNSSNSSCGSAEYTGEVIPHPPGLQRQDSGHWWTSFFFAKQNQPGMPNGSDTQKNSTYTVANGQCKQRQRKVRNIDPSTYFRLDSTPASPTCLLPSPPHMAPTWPLHGPHMASTARHPSPSPRHRR